MITIYIVIYFFRMGEGFYITDRETEFKLIGAVNGTQVNCNYFLFKNKSDDSFIYYNNNSRFFIRVKNVGCRLCFMAV